MPRIARTSATSGAAVALVASFLPWLRSGERSRSSYDLLEIVDRLGFSPDGVFAGAVWAWPLLPLLLVVVTIAHWVPSGASGIRWARVAVTGVAAAWSGGTAVAVLVARDAGWFSLGPGPWLTLGAAGLLALGAASDGIVRSPAISRGSAGRGAS